MIYARLSEIAHAIKAGIEGIEPFIQQQTEVVCPVCEERCCINIHGYFDDLDVIYMRAIGLELPSYRKELSDTDPCQFLTDKGCSRQRYLRPFRCNWYFCRALLNHMENGPSRPYREFIRAFKEIIVLREELLNESCRQVK